MPVCAVLRHNNRRGQLGEPSRWENQISLAPIMNVLNVDVHSSFLRNTVSFSYCFLSPPLPKHTDPPKTGERSATGL